MIRRILHWVASLLRRGLASLRGRNRATPQPVRTGTPAVPEHEPTAELPAPGQPVSNGADQAGEQKPGAQEFQEHVPAPPGTTEAGIPTETITAVGRDRAEGQRDTSSPPSIEAPENGPCLPPAPHTATPLPRGAPLRSPNETPPTTVVPPEKRGGRPRFDPSTPRSQGPAGTRARTPRPEIVCWKRSGEWVVGVEIPDDITQDSGVSVFQNGRSLDADDFRRGCYRLAALNKSVKVAVADRDVVNNNTKDIGLGDDNWLLFKLSGEELKQGRRVKQVSSGFYMAIVPETWKRDEEQAGNPPIAPERVFLDGYQAHFFEVADTSSSCIAFRDHKGKPIVITSAGAQFQLLGDQILDASERIGPLFGGKPPRVKILNAGWSQVRTIVIGEEGSGEHRWRKAFEPEPDQDEQELPAEVMERLAGWYFLRFYDHTEGLKDSLDFRFVAGLRGISVPKADPMPDRDGHAQQRVEILHDPEYGVTLLEPSSSDVDLQRCTNRTIVTIPPRAECDRTAWSMRPLNGKGQDVKLTILIERVWWALGSDDEEPRQWQDTPLKVTREYFAAQSKMGIWLRFPKPRWVGNVSAGFHPERPRQFPVRVNDRSAHIPLGDFSGAGELDDRGGEHQFKVWLPTAEGTHEVAVAVLRREEVGGRLDLASIPAHRLAMVLTKLRREARGPARPVIKKVRRKYRRVRRCPPERNRDFVREGLCLIAVLAEHECLPAIHLSEYWRTIAKQAYHENPEIARQLETLCEAER